MRNQEQICPSSTLQIYEVSFKKNLLTVFLLLSSLSVVADAAVAEVKFILFSLEFLIIGLLAAERRRLPISLNSRPLLAFLLLAVMIAVSIASHARNEDMNFLLKLVLAYSATLVLSFDEAMLALSNFSKLIFWPALIGLIMSVNGINIEVPANLLTENKSYFVTPVMTFQRSEIESRAYSIFWEPGALAFYANIVIAYKIFRLNKGLRAISLEIILIGMSQSAGGVIALTLLLLARAIRGNRGASRAFVLTASALMPLLLFYWNSFVSLAIEYANFLTQLILNRNLLIDQSFSARRVDLSIPFQEALQHPFAGNYDLDNYRDASVQLFGYSANIITNSWGSIAYFHGLPFLIVFAGLSLVALKHLSVTFNLPLVVWFFVMLSSTPTHSTVLILFFIIVLQRKLSSDGAGLNFKHRMSS